MKVRGKILVARSAVLLAGAVMMAAIPMSGAIAAEPETLPWYYHGGFEAGANVFIERPPSGFGRAPAPDNWLTPRTSESIAKFEEFGKVPRGLFVDWISLKSGSNDGRYVVNFWANDVGLNNQSYYLDIAKTGEHYLTVGWDQTPHLISTSAKTIFGGAGSNSLTVSDALQTTLQANSQNATATGAAGVTARTNIENAINSNATSLTLSTQRDKGLIAYRYTPTDEWDFKVDYSHEHRTGTRPLSINWSSAFGGTPGFATNIVEAIQPIDDLTQNVSVSGQYNGFSPWGKRWTASLKYSGSLYDNSFQFLDVENPFCITCAPGGGAGARGPNVLRNSLPPSNSAHAFMFNNAADLPWQSRWTSAIQYNMMRQNEPFVNTETVGNGLTLTNPLPASSADAAINTLLINNVLTTKITNDLKSTLRYRYYDFDNETPERLWNGYIFADSSVSTNQRRNLAIAYTKQNASADLNWRALRWLRTGVSYGWEQYDRTRRDVDVTNEHTGKLYMDADLWSDMLARASVLYASRRYQNYDAVAFVEEHGIQFSENLANVRKYDISNRNRLKGEFFLDIPIDRSWVVTPNLGFRDDRFQDNVFNQLGVKKDTSWNAGIESSARVNPALRTTLSYNFEERQLKMEDCCGSAAGGLIPQNIWSSDITQHYHTVIAALDLNVIPQRLDFRLDYLFALSSEANDTTPCASGASGCTGTGTGVTTTQFPTESNNFHRFNATARYHLPPEVVSQMGWIGEVTAKLRYTYERNRMENWAIDNMTPYIPTADQTNDLTGGGRSIFLAYNNPNYTAQFIAMSLSAKW